MRRSEPRAASRAWLAALSALLLALFLTPPVRAAELVMVESPGCYYCISWKKTLGPIYPKTEAGQYAPLRMIDIKDAPPEDVALTREVVFTPTFVLVEDGQELGRIEGYPGEDFFWALLERMLTETTDFATPEAKPGES